MAEDILDSEEYLSGPVSEGERRDMERLCRQLPRLGALFRLHRAVGSGSFSTVYLASLQAHSALPPARRRWFAVKHLLATTHPTRVALELSCLRRLGGQDHVAGVELCMRRGDTVVFVMPYMPHRSFSEVVNTMDAEELRRYMKALLQALCRVHDHGIIHRDIKPSNFLYDRKNQRYMLVDFGLAQLVCTEPPPPATSSLAGRKRTHREAAPCRCAGRGGVCGRCAALAGARAARGGTAGYRPPEVLLKVRAQGAALDMWAAGVVMVAALLGRHPLFGAAGRAGGGKGGDLAALAELAGVVGTHALRRAAARQSRSLCLSSSAPGTCLRRLCALLRVGPVPLETDGTVCAVCRAPGCVCAPSGPNEHPGRWWGGFPDVAFSLATRLLDPLPSSRISAREALQHPFILGAY